MLKSLESVNKWYVLNQGFRTFETCTSCQSSNILYFKVRTISHRGIAPVCGDCGKEFAVRLKLIRSSSPRERGVV